MVATREGSYLELYNKKFDLLVVSANAPGISPLAGRLEASGYFNFLCLTEELVRSEEQLLSLLQRGEKNRQVRRTPVNDRSSRSHVFRILRVLQPYGHEHHQLIYGKLARSGIIAEERPSQGYVAAASHLVIADLVGSENASHTGILDDIREEGIHINWDISVLKKVIRELNFLRSERLAGTKGREDCRDGNVTVSVTGVALTGAGKNADGSGDVSRDGSGDKSGDGRRDGGEDKSGDGSRDGGEDKSGDGSRDGGEVKSGDRSRDGGEDKSEDGSRNGARTGAGTGAGKGAGT
ncbi:kinesin-like protein KIN-7L [Hyalella azteca]|uniref:Kinesin-like protein KIN-7L n=1 Tax=Hyalella azteca TaxID=294128 RepID=A0A8B7PF76_HYAAZ|nr:kinesin-like protein KIN-7L [Hyalella azteca]